MKILHVCLAAFYIDGYAYQENVLPRMHKNMGFEVRILASCETFKNNQMFGYVEPSSYINEDGIRVTRLPYRKGLPLSVAKKLRYYVGVSEFLEDYAPDLVFLHDIQFLDISKIIEYKRKHRNAVIVADGHTDYINSARGFISKRILHGIIYRTAIRRSEKYINMFYGTLPPRNSFMEEMYGIPKSKIEYLPLGVDDKMTKALDHLSDKRIIAQKYGINNEDYLVVTGGKFDLNKKNVIPLMDAISRINGVSLLIYGSFSEELEEQAKKRLSDKIVFAGWLNEKNVMQVVSAADIAAYPYLHSTLWEQTAGIGTPLIVKKIQGFDHVNINGNCRFFESCDEETMKNAIIEARDLDKVLKNKAKIAKESFMYSKIAKHVIDEYEVYNRVI